MSIVILTTSLIISFFVRRQILYWNTIALLGFDFCTPEICMRHPGIYHCSSWFLIFTLFVIVSLSTAFSLWLRVVLFTIMVLVSEMEGKLKATKRYKWHLQDMLCEDDLDEERKKRIISDLNKSHSELLREKRELKRMLSGKF